MTSPESPRQSYPLASKDSMSNRLRRPGVPKRRAPEIIRLGRIELEEERIREIRDRVQESWDTFYKNKSSIPNRRRGVLRILRGGAS